MSGASGAGGDGNDPAAPRQTPQISAGIPAQTAEAAAAAPAQHPAQVLPYIASATPGSLPPPPPALPVLPAAMAAPVAPVAQVAPMAPVAPAAPAPAPTLRSLLTPFQPPSANPATTSPLKLLTNTLQPETPPPAIDAVLAALSLFRPKLDVFKQLSDPPAPGTKLHDSLGNLGEWIDFWRAEGSWRKLGNTVKFLAAVEMTESFFSAHKSLAKRVRALKTVKAPEREMVKAKGGDAAEVELDATIVAAGTLIKTWVKALKPTDSDAAGNSAAKDKAPTSIKKKELGTSSSGIKRKTTAEIAAAAMSKPQQGSRDGASSKVQTEKKHKVQSSKSAATSRPKNQPPTALSTTMMDDDLFGGAKLLKSMPRVPRKSESAQAQAAAPSSNPPAKPVASRVPEPAPLRKAEPPPSALGKPLVIPTTPAPSALRRAKAKSQGKPVPSRRIRVKFASGRDAVHVRFIESREELATMWDESVLKVGGEGIGGNSSGATGIGGRERESENERLREQKEQRLRRIDGMKEEMMWPLARYRVKVELSTEINMARSELYVGKELLEAEKRIQGATAVFPTDLIGHPLDPPLHEKGSSEKQNTSVPWIPLEFKAKGSRSAGDDKAEGEVQEDGPSQALLHAAASITPEALSAPPSFNPSRDFDPNLLPMLAANPALITNLDALVQMARMQAHMINTPGSGFGQDIMELGSNGLSSGPPGGGSGGFYYAGAANAGFATPMGGVVHAPPAMSASYASGGAPGGFRGRWS